MINDIHDERYSIADEAIMDAFLLVLKEKDIAKVTVSDVIKKAGIVRSTFYNHYENIPALITATEDKTLSDIFTLMHDFHPKNNHDMCNSFFLTVCDYTMNNPFLSNLLLHPTSDAFFKKSIGMLHQYVAGVARNKTSSPISTDEYSYFVACAIGSTIGVLHKWSKDGFLVPKENISELLTQTFLNGMLPQLI